MKRTPVNGSSLKRNLWLLGSGYFLQGFVTWYAVEKLFYRSDILLSYQQIGYIGVAATASILLFEFPSGILADRWSRKGTLIIGSLFQMVSTSLFAIGNSFLVMILGTIFWGFYYASQSGTGEALLYDTLKESSEESQFEKYLALVLRTQGISLAIGSIIGGLVASKYGFRINYWITLIPMTLSIIMLMSVHEPKQHFLESNPLQHAKQALRNAVSKKILVYLSLGMIFLAILTHLIHGFYQLYFIAVNLPTELFGVGNALLCLSFTIGAYLAVALRKANKSNAYFSIILGFILMQIAMLFVRSNWAMMVIFTSTVLMQTLDTFTQRELHDRIPSSERAATTSLLSSVGRGAAIPLSILIGYLTDKYDFFATIPIYVLFSILLGAILVFVTLNRHHQEPKLIINDPLV